MKQLDIFRQGDKVEWPLFRHELEIISELNKHDDEDRINKH